MPLRVHLLEHVDWGAILTEMHDERSFEGAWSLASTLLVFKDHNMPGPSVIYHGGVVATGKPVHLIYWGGWWLTPEGQQRRALLDERTKALIASPYFSQLMQYSVGPPTWRGSLICSEPGPPGSFTSLRNSGVKCADLIDDLIDDDVFPDPDEGRIVFIVLMPKGFPRLDGAGGAHWFDFDGDFLDTDRYWFGWTGYYEDPERTMVTVSHELVEIFTDPELDAWYSVDHKGEIADVSQPKGVQQTAWVSGALVTPYWSNQHSANVIPMDHGYGAQLAGTIDVTQRRPLNDGTFRPDPAESRLCSIVPECCIEDRDYLWEVQGRDELAVIRANTRLYRKPGGTWTVAGRPCSGNSGSLVIRLNAESYAGRDPHYSDQDVTLHYEVPAGANGLELRLRTSNSMANFDVAVGCEVSEGDIVGDVKEGLVAKPKVTVGFVGAELIIDPSYEEQRRACEATARKMFDRVDEAAWRPPVPGEEVEFGTDVMARLPAYTRVARYRDMRAATKLSTAAFRVLPRDKAETVHKALLARPMKLREMLWRSSR